MASQKELLSVKGQDKMEKLKDASWEDMGGPELDWSPEKYMSSASFKVALGIKPDSTILAKAGVKAEKGETVKEDKDMEDDDMLADGLYEEGDDEDEMKKHHEKSHDDEDEMTEASHDDDEDEMEEGMSHGDSDDPDADAVVDEASENSDEFEFTLDELTDGDVDLMDLGEAEDEDEKHEESEDEDEKHEESEDEDEKHEKSEDEDEMEEGYRMMREGDDEDAHEEEMPAKSEDEDEMEEGYRMMREEDDEDAHEDEDEDKYKKEKEPVEESRLVLSFKFDETDRLFESNQMLSEEDKQQSRRLFEAAIRGVAKQVSTKLNEAYAQKFARVKKQHEQRLAKQMDQYLSYVVEQWARENKVALRSQIQTKLTESFLSGLKSVFSQHYVSIPESKVDVVAALAKNVKTLKQQVRESEARTLKLHTEMKSAVARERQTLIREHRARLIAEAAAVLPAVDRGSFVKRAETLSFTNTKHYKKDLVALREQYFGAKKSGSERPMHLPDAAPLQEEEKTRSVKTPIDVYADAVTRFTR